MEVDKECNSGAISNKPKEGNKMAVPAIVSNIVQAVKSLLSTCEKMADGADAHKYATSVQSLNQDVDETYTQIRELIVKNDKYSDDQKIEKLEKLAQSQISARQSCQEAISGNREGVSKMIGSFFLALATCGLSYIPKLVTELKKNKINKVDIDKIQDSVIKQEQLNASTEC